MPSEPEQDQKQDLNQQNANSSVQHGENVDEHVGMGANADGAHPHNNYVYEVDEQVGQGLPVEDQGLAATHSNPSKRGKLQQQVK